MDNGVLVGHFLEEIGNDVKILTEEEVSEIKQAPLGQPITGNAKKGVYQVTLSFDRTVVANLLTLSCIFLTSFQHN